MKKSHESNELRSTDGFSAQMMSCVSAAKSKKQILSLLIASSTYALEKISRSGAVPGHYICLNGYMHRRAVGFRIFD